MASQRFLKRKVTSAVSALIMPENMDNNNNIVCSSGSSSTIVSSSSTTTSSKSQQSGEHGGAADLTFVSARLSKRARRYIEESAASLRDTSSTAAIASFRPLSKEDFNERLLTYQVFSWFCKPNSINPFICSSKFCFDLYCFGCLLLFVR